MARARREAGQRYGTVVLEERADRVGNHIYWFALCDCGKRFRTRTDRLVKSPAPSCGDYSVHDHAHVKHTLTYYGAHDRVKRVRGPAKDRACHDCGLAAQDWSYNHGDPEEALSPRGYRYSNNPNYYVPRCKPCHGAHDKRARKATEKR